MRKMNLMNVMNIGNLKRVLSLILVLCMLATVVGCGDKGKETESEQQVSDGFFGETFTGSSGEDGTSSGSSNGGTASGNTGTASDNGGTSSQKNTQTGSSSSKGSSTTEVPKENKIGGKSWKDVLAGMPKKLRGTTLVMYNWNPATEYTGATEVMDAFKKQTGIKVEWRTVTYNQYFTKLPALIASGENVPDMVRTQGPYPSFVQNFQPLSTAKYDFTDEAWDKNILDLYTFNGKQYAASIQNTHIGSINVLFYNKSLIDKYDFEDPYKLWKAGKWNWDKYIEMCEEYNELTGNPGSNGEGHFNVYLATRGISGSLSYNGKTYSSNHKKADFLKWHQTLGNLYNKESLFAFGGEADFNNGLVLFSIGTAIHARSKNSYFGNLKASNNLYMVPMPEHEDLKKYYQGYGEAEAYGIPKGASNPEAVPYFLRFFLDGSNYELSTYFGNKQNLEVYNWCMNRSNKVFAYDYPSGMAATGSTDGGIQVNTAPQMKSYIDSNSGKFEQLAKEYNETVAKMK